jgi:hypothetical protein
MVSTWLTVSCPEAEAITGEEEGDSTNSALGVGTGADTGSGVGVGAGVGVFSGSLLCIIFSISIRLKGSG